MSPLRDPTGFLEAEPPQEAPWPLPMPRAGLQSRGAALGQGAAASRLSHRLAQLLGGWKSFDG